MVIYQAEHGPAVYGKTESPGPVFCSDDTSDTRPVAAPTAIANLRISRNGTDESFSILFGHPRFGFGFGREVDGNCTNLSDLQFRASSIGDMRDRYSDPVADPLFPIGTLHGTNGLLPRT